MHRHRDGGAAVVRGTIIIIVCKIAFRRREAEEIVMSEDFIAEDIRVRLAQSMSQVERSRVAITQKVQERLQQLETPDEAFGQAEITAMMVVNLLIDGASDLAAFGRLRHLHRVKFDHQRLDIDGRHYSRFGLALSPVLQEVFGVTLPPKTASAWCDAFWFIVRRMTTEQTLDGPVHAQVRQEHRMWSR